MVLEYTVGLPLVLTIIVLIAWVWALYDILFVSDISAAQKVFWVIIVLIFSLIGIIFYILLGRKSSDYKIVKR